MTKRWVEQNFTLPPFDEREILRYAGVKGEADEGVRATLAACMQACEGVFSPKLVYAVLPIKELFSLLPQARESQGLREALGGSEQAIVFAATVGVTIDRKIARAGIVSPAHALFLQAIGAERIEALCDCFCKKMQRLYGGLGRRFSPGYGDLSLFLQREILSLLDASKSIGLSLTEGLMMTPTKSVTAIAGVGNCPKMQAGCAACQKENCEYRI